MLTIVLAFFVAAASPATAATDQKKEAPQNRRLQFSPSEKAWIEKNRDVAMCVDPDWPPFERLDEDGEHQGMASDYFALFSELTGLHFSVVPTTSWKESTEFFRRGKCRLLSMLNKTPERSKYMDFTEPYVVSPSVIVARDDASYMNGLEALEGKTMAMVPGYRIEEAARRDHPAIHLLPAANTAQALSMVSKGEAKATACSLVEATHLIRTLGLSNLIIAGHTKYDDHFRVGVAPDEPELSAVMRKAVDAVTPEEKNAIAARWIDVRYKRGEYRILWRILSVVALGGVLFTIWFWSISRSNKRLAAVNEQLKNFKRELEQKNMELEQLSRTDRLTGLLNRGRIDECLQHEMHRAVRYGSKFSVILADLDHFKQINDTLGHHAGDEVLIQFSALLKRHSRLTDICGRWGGEEFLIICPGVDEQGASTLAEHIRRRTEGEDFGIDRKITSSFGTAAFIESEDIVDLLARVDQALYNSKDRGRNRVTGAAGGPFKESNSS